MSSIEDMILNKSISRSEQNLRLNPSFKSVIGMLTMSKENLEKKWRIILIEIVTVNAIKLKLFSL